MMEKWDGKRIMRVLGNGWLEVSTVCSFCRRWGTQVRGVGNSYVANATLELYRHPFPDLVDQVRKSLKMLKVSSFSCFPFVNED